MRFIQTGTFQQVGGNRLESVDIRLLCATNRAPLAEVQAGRFREDLYYRLHVIPVALPALRDREDDVIQLAESFLTQYAEEEGKPPMSMTTDGRAAILNYNWPGNVRELQNVIRNVVVLNQSNHLTPDMLPFRTKLPNNPSQAASTPQQPNYQAQAPSLPEPLSSDIRPLWQVEKEAIEQAIAMTDGNIPKAAALLEVSPSTIYRKKQTWEQI